ncbi:MAG: hypothetical protein A3D24_04780 [Candidatus Blackburnbacteria bacterium RIFCSPHIGHO2_02_FULL_39_13]|uniref:Uncharacterized protein n=1 Tax=Candidatus Blackburnbacteria bacterium RIFCSPLOWO2_01_FULL_40_20 TaxID=1797519 RepID=A0A1G1VBD0_9BACT|nr:MAG: hypothetical protein UT38_C0007G0027 [Microgenomates group bacterium GW2011_GWA2_39_19]OGY07104.1 MAG: hypothetical protein A2694_03450 [Candidatus Blackburnbacteria bacterium RIFCSPHIGHO2_01_FULL_40_17]OGY08926.1 MAG: hypothetical protein A3D24_04780 [Candidatus Blackburnbacteria bacterium RIFCSPHIGHO2_02_FULL_39_13]OGY12728.1 MAG: hypothetical protein A3A77_00365 [Candidatus Blackburnbacteria bacterium RIFCSPLOWO2_01_FULL_40_20]OGY15291.1 MAG: hypothetical protein A3I52_01135 [Candida
MKDTEPHRHACAHPAEVVATSEGTQVCYDCHATDEEAIKVLAQGMEQVTGYKVEIVSEKKRGGKNFSFPTSRLPGTWVPEGPSANRVRSPVNPSNN